MLDPSSLTARIAHATILAELGASTWAVEELDAVLKIDPEKMPPPIEAVRGTKSP